MHKLLNLLVGARGFEPPTSCSQSRRATGLRYAPTLYFEGLRGFSNAWSKAGVISVLVL